MTSSRFGHPEPEKTTHVIHHGHTSPRAHARILHTSDWQLGMTRWFLEPDSHGDDDGGLNSQALYTGARFAAIQRMADVAHQRDCDLVVVAGDVFDKDNVGKRIQSRFIEAIEHFAPIPIVFLPGNHDPYQVGSVWRSSFAQDIEEAGGIILGDFSLHTIGDIEVFGAPLTSNRPTDDLVSAALNAREPAQGIRVMLGHGQPRRAFGNEDNHIDMETVDHALQNHLVDYIAMGDTHSVQQIDSRGGMWFSGSHEPTDFDNKERQSGYCLVVDLDVADGATSITVDPVHVAEWEFHYDSREITTDDDIESWYTDLSTIRGASSTVVKNALIGRITFDQAYRIDEYKQRLANRFAAYIVDAEHTNLDILPDSLDPDEFKLNGYFRKVLDDLNPNDDVDREALKLLYQLSHR
ncbi:exonuclease SbcCD subunit D [Corynebacterium kroppenstedtii]|uniref:metallophosphoesterase family protein n=1 Tax=Corynebacterium sp. PCR 32 TaxID=3351342 RepID=UPI0030A28E83